MKLPISARLSACAAMVPAGSAVADVGCDHGYLGISLLTENRARKVFACDLREGPLAQARRNAERFGVEDRMEFFLCDGLTGLAPGCADTVVIAGMGGDTIRHILEQSPWVMEAGIVRIVQPQSSVPEFREYLATSRLAIAEETLVREGRFLYTVMRLETGDEETISPWEQYCSRVLMQSGSDLLPEYLDRQIEGLRKAVAGMEKSGPSERLSRERNAMKELMEMRKQL